jgi:hypothetical protein
MMVVSWRRVKPHHHSATVLHSGVVNIRKLAASGRKQFQPEENEETFSDL